MENRNKKKMLKEAAAIAVLLAVITGCSSQADINQTENVNQTESINQTESVIQTESSLEQEGITEGHSFQPQEIVLVDTDVFKVKTDMGNAVFNFDENTLTLKVEMCNTSLGSVKVIPNKVMVGHEDCKGYIDCTVPNDGVYHENFLRISEVPYVKEMNEITHIEIQFKLYAQDYYGMAVTNIDLYSSYAIDDPFRIKYRMIEGYYSSNHKYFTAGYQPKETTKAGTDTLGTFELIGTDWTQEVSDDNRVTYVSGGEKVTLEKIENAEGNKNAVIEYMEATDRNMTNKEKNTGTYETPEMYAYFLSDYYALGEQFFRAYFYSAETDGIMHLEIDSDTMTDGEFEELINVLLFSYSNADFDRYTVNVEHEGRNPK